MNAQTYNFINKLKISNGVTFLIFFYNSIIFLDIYLIVKLYEKYFYLIPYATGLFHKIFEYSTLRAVDPKKYCNFPRFLDLLFPYFSICCSFLPFLEVSYSTCSFHLSLNASLLFCLRFYYK